MSQCELPLGIWYEAARERWRVRLYRNQRSWVSYHNTIQEALEAHARLQEALAAIPKGPRPKPAPVQTATFAAMTSATKPA